MYYYLLVLYYYRIFIILFTSILSIFFLSSLASDYCFKWERREGAGGLGGGGAKMIACNVQNNVSVVDV